MPDSLLKPEILACVLVAGAGAFGVSVVLRYIRERDKLDRVRKEADRTLVRVRKEIAEKQARIKQLEEELKMLRPLHERLSRYSEQLQQLQLEQERKKVTEDERKDDDNDEWGRKRYRLDR